MIFTVVIDCDNAAFDDDINGEIAECLDTIIGKLHNAVIAGNVRDSNGNSVGTFALLDQDAE